MTPSPPLPPALLRQFDYLRHPVMETSLARTTDGGPTRAGVAIAEVRLRAPGQDPIDAYLVTPASAGRHPAVLWLHWEGEAHADHSHFLAEAVDLAADLGWVSVLPRMVFPFVRRPIGDGRDRDAVITQVIQLRRVLDHLAARNDVDSSRIGLVGHDYGGMYGAMLAAIDPARISGSVLVAIDATWGNWFVTYFLRLPEEEIVPFTASFDTLQPTAFLPHLPRGGLMFQFADDDAYVGDDAVTAVVGGGPGTPAVRHYPTDHGMDHAVARSDRREFLAKRLAQP